MGVSVHLKPLSDSELSNIYLRYDEESKTKKKLREITDSNPDSFALIEWLVYIAFGEDYIEINEPEPFIDECAIRIQMAIHFWKEGGCVGSLSYVIPVIEYENETEEINYFPY